MEALRVREGQTSWGRTPRVAFLLSYGTLGSPSPLPEVVKTLSFSFLVISESPLPPVLPL